MAFCLLPEKVEEFKQALKSRAIDIGDLVKMSSEDRTAALKKYAGDNAKDVNTLFEEKLVLKNKMMGLRNWAAKMGEIGRYSEAGKAKIEDSLNAYKAAQQERIFSPKEDETFLNDLADRKLGVHIDRDVAAKVFDLASKADALKNAEPNMFGTNNKYLLARNALNDYVESQKPVSALKSIVTNLMQIGRNHLLMNPATPIKTTAGQVAGSAIDRITNRLASRSLGTANHAAAQQAYAEARQTWKETGVNVASVEGGRLSDGGLEKIGERSMSNRFAKPAGMENAGPVTRAVEAGVRGYAKATNKVAIDWEHNYTFTIFHQKAFFDAASLGADDAAKKSDLSSTDIFKDAIRIDPQTPEGLAVRTAAQARASWVTNTNETLLSNAAMAVKNALNDHAFGLGDLVMPIAKIPANILWNGLENAGLGILTGGKDIVDSRALMTSDDPAEQAAGVLKYTRGIQTVARTVGVMTAASLFASTLSKSDFRTDQYGGHYVKLGNLWVNMEYIAAASPALAGMMAWKAKGIKGQAPTDAVSQYAAGAFAGAKSIPGIDTLFQGLGDPVTLLQSRLWPAFVASVTSNRPTERLLFGAHGVESTAEVAQDNAASALKSAEKRRANAAAGR